MVESDMRSQRFKVFVLLITVPSRGRDRFKLLEVPLFFYHVFVPIQMNKQKYNAIVGHKGVAS